MVQAFRRAKSDDNNRTLLLRGLDAASQYEIRDINGGAVHTASGKDLMEQGFSLTISQQPGAAIVFYNRVR